ncbi:MAG: nucleoside triphosphate pyrophosphohydrolase [Verrucomicrobia bacterium]|nr:nucleoside triphosphate pyrophosphohydrolase [Verrucomicrobiota bacterium]
MTTPIDELRAIVARLRAPDGCPWDREQTHASLRGCLIEEAYETVEAIERADDAHLCEELGDLLLQVVMHSQMAAETGRFTFNDVASGLNAKLIRRHPHVFGEVKAADTGAVLQRWEEIKRAEKGNTHTSALDGVSGALPALLHAEKVTKKAARVGFDWESPVQVIGKIREELAETEEALEHGAHDKIEEELGDLLFAAVNLARKIKVEPEVALRRATGKFSKRFQALEVALKERGRKPEECTLAEMDAIWDEIKGKEKSGNQETRN